MSAGTSELFCLICFLVCSCTAQKIITAEKITADVGQNVTLPCKVPNNKRPIGVVEWNRSDQETGNVFSSWYGWIEPENQPPSYQNRTDLQDKEMKDGDVSLVLKDVKLEDTGTYVCYVYQTGKTIEPICNIKLEVHLSGDMVGIVVGSAVGVILLLAVASLGFLIYRRHMMKNQDVSVPPDEAAAKQIL